MLRLLGREKALNPQRGTHELLGSITPEVRETMRKTSLSHGLESYENITENSRKEHMEGHVMLYSCPGWSGVIRGIRNESTPSTARGCIRPETVSNPTYPR